MENFTEHVFKHFFLLAADDDGQLPAARQLLFTDVFPQPNQPSREWVEEYVFGEFTQELSHEHSLFDHSEYGDVPDGIAPHVNNMAGLDRIIFEDCVESGGAVQAAHLNLNDVQYYKRPETIARKCSCEIDEACALLDSWAVIGDNEQLVTEYLRWTNARGINTAITYFVDMADELLAVEGEAFVYDDERPETPGVAPREYGYHPIGEREEPDYYEDIAPSWVRRAIQRIQRTRDLKALAAVGKQAFGANMGVHTGTIWMHYNAQKAKLTPDLSHKACEIIDFIGECRTKFKLGKVGKRLYELQAESHRVEGNLAIADTDWSKVWGAYREKKAEL